LSLAIWMISLCRGDRNMRGPPAFVFSTHAQKRKYAPQISRLNEFYR
jgi:hypothetical protein